jgi:hypothetical protein
MKKSELGMIGILKRALSRSSAASFIRSLKLIGDKPQLGSDLQTFPNELPELYIPYDELMKIRLHLLELERQRAEAICVARLRICE